MPPLVTAGPTGVAQAQAGVLGAPGTRVLFGGSVFGEEFRTGGRIHLGFWLDDEHTWGVEASYFFLNSIDSTFRTGSPNQPILSRPFIDAATGQQTAELVAFPGVVAGTVTVDTHSSLFQGSAAGFRKSCCCGDDVQLDVLFGYRFLRLGDRLNIQEDLTGLDPARTGGTPAGTRIVVADHFETTNSFHGGYVGAGGEWRTGVLGLGCTAKVALGYNERCLRVKGGTDVTVPGFATVSRPGGLLALASNLGTHRSSSLAFLPEAGLHTYLYVTPNLRLRAGYTFLYWDRLWRTGQQVDLTVNRALLPPADLTAVPARPLALEHDSSLWVHGIDLGAELRF